VVSGFRIAPDIADQDNIRGTHGAQMRSVIYGDHECA